MYQTHFDQTNALRRQDAAAQISAKIDSYAQNGRKVWMPGTKTLAVYYLFTHRDLSPVYMKRFEKGARLDMIGKVHFANVACPTIEDGSEMKKYSVGDTVVLEGTCPQEGIPYLKHLETVRGVSELLGYRIYTVVRDPLAPIQVQ